MRVAGCGVEWKGELGSVDDRGDTTFQSARGRGKCLEHVHVGETERTRKDEHRRETERDMLMRSKGLLAQSPHTVGRK